MALASAFYCLKFVGCVLACKHNPVIKRFADRLEKAGKPFKVMMTACMRKLLIILNTMIRNNATWSPTRNTQKP